MRHVSGFLYQIHPSNILFPKNRENIWLFVKKLLNLWLFNEHFFNHNSRELQFFGSAVPNRRSVPIPLRNESNERRPAKSSR